MEKGNLTAQDIRDFCIKQQEAAKNGVFHVPEQYYAIYADKMNQHPSPSFSDIKRELKDLAIMRQEPIEHLLIEIYGSLVTQKILLALEPLEKPKPPEPIERTTPLA